MQNLEVLSAGQQIEKDAEGKPKHKGSGRELTYRDDITGDNFVRSVTRIPRIIAVLDQRQFSILVA